MRQIILQPLAQAQIRALPQAESDALVEALMEVAEAEAPEALLGPYMPGGIGPVAYHGVLHAGGQAAVVSLYEGEVRVIRISPDV